MNDSTMKNRSSGEKSPLISILMVCLGNICRSPTAEGVLRQLAATSAPELQLQIDSAGTADYHVGKPPDRRAQQAARKRGIDLSGMRARRVVAEDFARHDFILAMDRANLRDLEALRPPGSRAKLGLFLDYAGQAAGTDMPDPYDGDADDFERVLDLATAASRGLITVLQEGS